MLDNRGVKKRSAASYDAASTVNSIDSATSSRAQPSPRKAPAKTTTTRGRGAARGGRGAARGGASSSKADLDTTVSPYIYFECQFVKETCFRKPMGKHNQLLRQCLPLLHLNEHKPVLKHQQQQQHEPASVNLRVKAILHNTLRIPILIRTLLSLYRHCAQTLHILNIV